MVRQNLHRVRYPRLGAQMSAWIATAFAVAITAGSAITAANADPCGPGSTRHCFNIPTRVDFSSVSEISKRIATDEKTGQKQKQRTAEPSTPAPYTGPTFGAGPRPGRCRLSAIPGHWSDGTVFCDHTSARRLQNTWPTCRCRRVTRDDEIEAISQFIALNGITRCPAAYAAPTATDLSPARKPAASAG
jgi:hypothetical protein